MDTPTPIDTYLAGFSGLARERLNTMRALFREEMPDGVEVISYGIPTFDIGGHHVAHFAGFAKHVGLYPTPQGVTAFEAELSAYPQGKGSVQFPHSQPLPVDLIRRVVRHQAEAARALPPKKPRKG